MRNAPFRLEFLSDKLCRNAALQEAGKYTDAPQFYKYLTYRCEIHFTDKRDADNDGANFSLELSKIMTYDQIAAKVGEHLRIDPTHLRFMTVNATTGRPKATVKRSPNQTLQAIFNPHYGAYGQMSNQRNDWLFYEILDMSLEELETKKSVKISMLSEGITKEVSQRRMLRCCHRANMKQDVYEVLVPKTGTLADVVSALQNKVGLSEEVAKSLRFIEVHSSKVYKELPLDQPVQSFSDYITVYAERTPQDELDADDAVDRAVYAFHFDKDPSKTHGIPFKFVVKPDEKFSDTRERLSKRTGIKGKLLEKVRFATISRQAFSKPEYLTDGKSLATMVCKRHVDIVDPQTISLQTDLCRARTS